MSNGIGFWSNTLCVKIDGFAVWGTECEYDFASISKVALIDVEIYPNPTNGIVNLEFADNNIQKLIISDITGKTIIEKINIQQNETIDLSSFESGIYIISWLVFKRIMKYLQQK